MNGSRTTTKSPAHRGIHWWVRRFFFAWAILSTLWVANKMRTRGVDDEMLRTSPTVAVSDGAATLEFRSVLTRRHSGFGRKAIFRAR